jgi:hypothetical protein
MKESSMWQLQAMIALDLARERAAQAEARARLFGYEPRPSVQRRASARVLRAVRDLANGLGDGAGSLAERLEGRAA